MSQLQAYWDEVLKDSGFKDIEDRKTGLLKSWSGTVSLEHTKPNTRCNGSYSSLVWKESQAKYYHLAQEFLHSKYFKSARAKKIWAYHAAGDSLTVIADKMKLTRRQVRYAIHCMKKEFGLGLSQTNKDEATNGSNHEARAK